MTFSEFKSWLDGFSEALGDAPSPEQWAKIKAKLGEVWDSPIPITPIIGSPALPTYPMPYMRYFDTNYPHVPSFTVTCAADRSVIATN